MCFCHNTSNLKLLGGSYHLLPNICYTIITNIIIFGITITFITSIIIRSIATINHCHQLQLYNLSWTVDLQSILLNTKCLSTFVLQAKLVCVNCVQASVKVFCACGQKSEVKGACRNIEYNIWSDMGRSRSSWSHQMAKFPKANNSVKTLHM